MLSVQLTKFIILVVRHMFSTYWQAAKPMKPCNVGNNAVNQGCTTQISWRAKKRVFLSKKQA